MMSDKPALTISFKKIPAFRKAKRSFEAAYVKCLLLHTEGNVSAAARHAGKDRKDFYDLARRCGVKPETFRP